MKVVFWGSPDFALPSLHAIVNAGKHQIVGVVTQPDRPRGRGRKLSPPPVKVAAQSHDLRIVQPERPRGPEFMSTLRELAPDISVVVAYGEILDREVLDVPRLGSFNLHASLLPELRGAAPVHWAIIRGHKRTGVTVMRMVEELDAGPIVLQEAVEIARGATVGSLAEGLARLGAETLCRALNMIEAGTAEERPQPEDATYAPKLSRDEVRLDWRRPAAELDRWIRGCDPIPGAWSELDGQSVRVFTPRVLSGESTEPGLVEIADPKAGLVVQAGRGRLAIDEVQPAGKRRMRSVDWIRGRGVAAGQCFE